MAGGGGEGCGCGWRGIVVMLNRVLRERGGGRGERETETERETQTERQRLRAREKKRERERIKLASIQYSEHVQPADVPFSVRHIQTRQLPRHRQWRSLNFHIPLYFGTQRALFVYSTFCVVEVNAFLSNPRFQTGPFVTGVRVEKWRRL